MADDSRRTTRELIHPDVIDEHDRVVQVVLTCQLETKTSYVQLADRFFNIRSTVAWAVIVFYVVSYAGQ